MTDGQSTAECPPEDVTYIRFLIKVA